MSIMIIANYDKIGQYIAKAMMSIKTTKIKSAPKSTF